MTGYDRGLFCVNSRGSVEDTFDFNFHSSYGRSSPGLIDHITIGDETNIAWYVNSSGDLNNPNPGMMGGTDSITNVRMDSYGLSVPCL